ncbi:uncharacterized protein LOC112589959 isoform X2 [Harpegnathos saltator]|uniref:uncharacterized protein LOC112589959 isoform X2 n=1 Tax=Harpegnathos saltator TaxID=610380 RepID=UPI000DBEDCB1|nr:uncharacterized protein LOC112589959 isoform X2 [Harpegnathos saltator]
MHRPNINDGTNSMAPTYDSRLGNSVVDWRYGQDLAMLLPSIATSHNDARREMLL